MGKYVEEIDNPDLTQALLQVRARRRSRTNPGHDSINITYIVAVSSPPHFFARVSRTVGRYRSRPRLDGDLVLFDCLAQLEASMHRFDAIPELGTIEFHFCTSRNKSLLNKL